MHDIYLKPEYFNTTANATIPAAWIVVLGGQEQVFGRENEFTAETARKGAQRTIDEYEYYNSL